MELVRAVVRAGVGVGVRDGVGFGVGFGVIAEANCGRVRRRVMGRARVRVKVIVWLELRLQRGHSWG